MKASHTSNAPPAYPPDPRVRLTDPRTYERQIDRLHEHHLLTRSLHELRQDGVSLAGLVRNRSKVARLIARTVERGEYTIEPATIRRLRVEGKDRDVFAFRLTDLIVHGAVAAIVEEAMTPTLSPRLFSYRPGLSWWTPVSQLAATARAHRRSTPDPRGRGMYVLRRDIDAYTDSIPVGATSRVWSMVREVLVPSSSAPLRPAEWRLIERVVRPEHLVARGGVATLLRGVATGQPISCVLFNLYLAGFDREFDGIADAFYARYSDDILFAHTDPDVVRDVSGRMDRALAALDLRWNEEKSRDLYWTGAGRASSVWPDARGSTAVPFLGTHVQADGTVSLSRRKMRSLLRDVQDRAGRTATALRGADRERVGRTVCTVVNRALHPDTALYQQRSATLVRRAVTDRRQLAQLDYRIARIVARAVTGQRGVRALRDVPYRRMRRDWRLVSLEHARNTGRG